MNLPSKKPTLDQLPEDIILSVLCYLDVPSVSCLARTCRVLHAIVSHSGWKAYSVENALPSPSFSPALRCSRWSARDLVRQQWLAQNAWKSRKFITRPLGPGWPSRYRPVMAISSSHLVVAAGNALYFYKFVAPGNRPEPPRVVFDRVVTFPRDPRRDVSGVAFEPDGQHVVLSFYHGALCRLRMPLLSTSFGRRSIPIRALDPTYVQEQGPPIRSLSVARNIALTIDYYGQASLHSLINPDQTLLSTTNVAPPASGWSTHLSLHSSSGYVVLGSFSATPLVVHSITETSLSPTPSTTLSLPSKLAPSSNLGAVYSVTGATRTFPYFSSSDQVVVSGWYQGIISIHDLRCRTQPSSNGPTLLPAQVMRDPLMLAPIYSLSSAGAHIAAGSAHNSVLHLYDVRSPKSGWSIYLPQGPSSSPVYSCLLESTRVWAATQSYAFVVDFGEVHEHTFPPIRDDDLTERLPNGLGWHAPHCEHGMLFRQLR